MVVYHLKYSLLGLARLRTLYSLPSQPSSLFAQVQQLVALKLLALRQRIVEQLQFSLWRCSFRKKKEQCGLGRREDVSDLSDEAIKQRARLLYLLLDVKYLSRASQDLPSFRLDLSTLFFPEQFLETLHEVRLDELPPVAALLLHFRKVGLPVHGRPQQEPINVGQVSVDESFVEDVEDGHALAAGCPNAIDAAIQANIDLCVAVAAGLGVREGVELLDHHALYFCVFGVLSQGRVTTSSVCMRALKISVLRISISSLI